MRDSDTNIVHGALHGHIFVLGADREFHPYEFRLGLPPPMNTNDNAFIAAAQKYLELNDLANIIDISSSWTRVLWACT